MLQIQFRKTSQVSQVSLAQGGYSRSFVRDEQPFALHEEPHWAEFEQRFIPTHEYLELVEVEVSSAGQSSTNTTSLDPQTVEGQTEAAPAAANPTSETRATENPTAAVSALQGTKKKN